MADKPKDEDKPQEQQPQRAEKVSTHFFKCLMYPGLTVQVQKMVKNSDGSSTQEVDEQATFTQYYDVYKGDTIRVGFLKTTSEKIAKACESDLNCIRIKEAEYSEAVDGVVDKEATALAKKEDSSAVVYKIKPLDKAPVPAV